MRTSDHIAFGAVYTRDDLRKQFNISDATINTGVFRPKGHDSIWLFVTEHKTADRTPYADRLESESLFWQGQMSGRSDSMIIDHAANGLELLLFHRRSKYEFPKAGFRFVGRFEYMSHLGQHPTSFLLHRIGQVTAPLKLPETDGALPAVQDDSSSSCSPPGRLGETLAWLGEKDRVTESELRTRLLPLDLLPAALIDELNERSLDLVGDTALEVIGDEIIVAMQIYSKVIASLV